MESLKIIVLDGHTSNPDDLSWDGLSEFGELSVFPRTPDDRVIERAKGARVLIMNKIKMTREKIEALPDLQYIGLLATGFDNVDLEAARANGVIVTNIPSYSTPSVAQHTFALLLQLTNRVALHDRSVHEMDWVRSKDFSYFKEPLTELAGKYMGIVGYGQIGKAVAALALAFGMKVLVCSEHSTAIEGMELVALPELFERSDVISLHTAITPEKKGMINASLIGRMKSSAILVNTSRGGIINEEDLADALNRNAIRGAALDVLSSEPPARDNPLLVAKNCVLTPHISWATLEARTRLMKTVVGNVRAFVEGDPVNVVN